MNFLKSFSLSLISSSSLILRELARAHPSMLRVSLPLMVGIEDSLIP
ncbi:MAG: hypothetical protein GH159_03685 [Dehalococcoidia bacterium]|nr:hypothetical protein [Dehalococcoidia bacterium]